MRVRWNRRESSVGLGPNRVPRCCYGLTYHNQVEIPLVIGRPVKVKGLDLWVNRARIRSVGGLGGINGTQTCIVS